DQAPEFPPVPGQRRHGELPTEGSLALPEFDLVPTLRGDARRFQTRRATADHQDALALLWRYHLSVTPAALAACHRVYETADGTSKVDRADAALVTADAGPDVGEAALSCLTREGRVGQQRPRHDHHVRLALGQDSLGVDWVDDSPHGHDRHRQSSL